MDYPFLYLSKNKEEDFKYLTKLIINIYFFREKSKDIQCKCL